MATIDFDPEDYLHEVSSETLAAELALRDKPVPRGAGDGDPQPRRYVDDAEHAARAMPDCPQAFLDLLWHVHGRAIA